MADPFDLPSLRHQLLDPIKTLTRLFDFIFSGLCTDHTRRKNITLVCISDTHCQIPKDEIPHGDILIHAGDLTNKGTPSELQAQIEWLSTLPHKYKIVIAGNHDTWLDPKSRRTLSVEDQDGKIDWKDVLYLQDGSTTLDFTNRIATGNAKLKVYGAPHIPACGGDDFAFQYPRGQDVWTGTIPVDTDILVTHNPPKYHLDLPGGAALGDEHLLEEVRRVKPRLHVFGHVHAGRSDALSRMRDGQEHVRWDGSEKLFAKIMGEESSNWAILRFLDFAGWITLAYFVLVLGPLSILSEIVLDREVPSTRLVNAALMYRNTGKLLNKPQVVHI